MLRTHLLQPHPVWFPPPRYVGTQWKYNKQLADLGMHCYLKMLLKVWSGAWWCAGWCCAS